MNSIPRDEVMEAQILEKRKPKLDDSFIKQIDDKDFVLYGGLLDVAHQKNLSMVDVELIQFPSDQNKQTAICKAVVQTLDGKKFSDIGDANPMNCNSKVAKHLIRMASTRAKARAFRDMDNIGMTCLEELGDLNDVIGDVQRRPAQPKKENVRAFTKPVIKAVAAPQSNVNSQGAVKTEAPINEPQCANQEQAPATDTINANVQTETQPQTDQAPQAEKKTRTTKPSNGNGKDKTDKIILMSEAQKSALFNLSRRRGISLEDLESRSMEKYGLSTEQLTSGNAGEFIRSLQQSA
jgi:hypothetical protein